MHPSANAHGPFALNGTTPSSSVITATAFAAAATQPDSITARQQKRRRGCKKEKDPPAAAPLDLISSNLEPCPAPWNPQIRLSSLGAQDQGPVNPQTGLAGCVQRCLRASKKQIACPPPLGLLVVTCCRRRCSGLRGCRAHCILGAGGSSLVRPSSRQQANSGLDWTRAQGPSIAQIHL
ncbi:hypothetical protein E4U54_003290 [Claviceps lovelessii]|nr:hypothetical protein E4U54_003290 [Claviceps lovelessii]